MPKNEMNKSITCFILALVILLGLAFSLESRYIEKYAQANGIPNHQAQIEVFNNRR